MKKLFTLVLVSVFLFSFTDNDKYKDLSKSEIKYVKNIERMEEEELVSVTKFAKYMIVLEFGTIKYLLDTRTGFATNVWILNEDDRTWEELGSEY
jgi:hypothetical protein